MLGLKVCEETIKPWLRESLAADSYDALGVDVRKSTCGLDELKATLAVECVDADFSAESLKLVEVLTVWAYVEVDEAVGGAERGRTVDSNAFFLEAAYALCGDGLDYLEGAIVSKADAGDRGVDCVRDIEDVRAGTMAEVDPACGELLSISTESV